MKVAVIKYNAGNVQSILFALERIGVKGILTDDPFEIQSADKVIFPGVGEASSAMQFLKEKKLDTVIRDMKQPTLGICLGMQLMCKHSEEGNIKCLGIFDSVVKKFNVPVSPGPKGGNIEENENVSSIDQGREQVFKIPQIGWNNIFNLQGDLFTGVPENSFMYFVHSYYVEQNKNSIATTNYILGYCSAMQKDNFYAVQFHPEKSSEAGQKILENFLNL
jgi:glutamine amidotransferase